MTGSVFMQFSDEATLNAVDLHLGEDVPGGFRPGGALFAAEGGEGPGVGGVGGGGGGAVDPVEEGVYYGWLW